jgi:multidrug efflux pump subunit AcrA (membrane-fusion protein)
VPWARRVVYPPTTGTVEEFRVEPNDIVTEGRELARMFDTDLARKLRMMQAEVDAAYYEMVTAQHNASRPNLKPDDRINYREKAETLS